jgi:hypothetical protein
MSCCDGIDERHGSSNHLLIDLNIALCTNPRDRRRLLLPQPRNNPAFQSGRRIRHESRRMMVRHNADDHAKARKSNGLIGGGYLLIGGVATPGV